MWVGVVEEDRFTLDPESLLVGDLGQELGRIGVKGFLV